MTLNKSEKLGTIIYFIVSLFLILSCAKEKEINVVIVNENQKKILEDIILYKNYDTEIISNGSYWIIKNFNVELALEAARIASMNLDVIKKNMENVNTTRDIEGLPYIRKYLKITVENGVEIVEDRENYPTFVYNPAHKDSIKTGEMEGYVKQSNVDIVKEMQNMTDASSLYEAAIEYLKKKNYIIF